jgi:DNA-binding MarR family transcriptional regulator
MDDKACHVSDIEYETGSLAEIFQLIDTLAKKLTQLQREKIRVTELTPAQYSVLTLLWKEDGRQLNELAAACCCSPSTITGVVDTLEKKGLATRELNPNDRRSLLVRLTERGEELKDTAPALGRILNGCCPGIESDELRQLSELLRKLNDTLTA